jgi:hypothetical protein
VTKRDEPKVALVTGGSRGLGRNTALHLGRRDVRVILTYRRGRASADSTVSEIVQIGGQAVALRLDVGDTGCSPTVVASSTFPVGSPALPAGLCSLRGDERCTRGIEPLSSQGTRRAWHRGECRGARRDRDRLRWRIGSRQTRSQQVHFRTNCVGSCRSSGRYRWSDRFSALGGESLDHRTVHRSLGRDVLVTHCSGWKRGAKGPINEVRRRTCP